jgi:hypothetical protein
MPFSSAHRVTRPLTTCKRLSASTDPTLFHTIVIVPCPAYFSVITTLPHPDAINRHMRRFIYDDPLAGLRRQLPEQISQNKLAILHLVAKTRLFQTLDGLSQLTRPFKENTCYEVMCCKRVLDLLLLLRTVSVLSSHQT